MESGARSRSAIPSSDTSRPDFAPFLRSASTARLWTALSTHERTLPDDQRQVIELAYFGGLSHTQIAEVLDLPPGTVKGRMRLGLSKMRSALGEAERVAL